MIENVLNDFRNDIFQFLTKNHIKNKGLLIKKHSEHLQHHGDFSFPNTPKSWHQYVELDCEKDSDITILACIQKGTSDIISESINWNLEVAKVKEDKDRVYLFLNRPKSIIIGLNEAQKNNVTVMKIVEEETGVVYNLQEDNNGLTSLRLKYLTMTIKKLYSITPKAKTHLKNLIVSSKSSVKHKDTCSVLCGAVLNLKTGGKETNITADDYIRMRQNEMILIAQHKYGVRVSTDEKWKEFIEHLGESAVVFELLQTKPSSAVKINFECSSAGSSKGAAFILYNCARLEAIIRSYSEKVTEGIYPPLPDFENTDFSLLTQKDEWCLVFNYIMGFPSLLESCVEINENFCEFRPHLLCSFLCSMVRVFSQYYRKVRILTEPRKHLLPVLFARLHMLKILNDTLKTCLYILNIKSVSQMYTFILFRRLSYLFANKNNECID